MPIIDILNDPRPKQDIPRRIAQRHFWFHARAGQFTIEHGITTNTRLRDADAAKGERSLGAFTLPSFQRPSIWTDLQRTRLIESLWIGLPIGSYVVNEDDRDSAEFDRWLLDGQQRWTTIIDYVNDEFDVFGWRYSELSWAERAKFRRIIVPSYVTNITDYDALLDVYDRLAYGGTPHESRPEHLRGKESHLDRVAREALGRPVKVEEQDEPEDMPGADNDEDESPSP